MDRKISEAVARFLFCGLYELPFAASLALATSSDDVRAAQDSDRTAIILGFQNALAFERDVSRIDALHADGVRVFGLTHMGHNDFADSSRPLFNGATGAYEATEEHGSDGRESQLEGMGRLRSMKE